MKGILWLLLLFSTAVGFALATLHHSGYVVMVYPPWRVEMALSFFTVLLLAGLGVFYLLVRLAIGTLNLPATVRAYHTRRHEGKNRHLLETSLIAWFEQRYNRAEKTAAELLQQPHAPALAGLIAALSAHQLKAWDRRDGYLAELDHPDSPWALPAAITRASLWTEQRRYAEALDEVQRLRRVDRRNAALALSELKLQHQLRNWPAVLDLSKELADRDGNELMLQQFRRQAIVALMRKQAADQTDTARNSWKRLSPEEQIHPDFVAPVVQVLQDTGHCALARELLDEALTAHWDSRLAALYGGCHSDDPTPLLEKAENWLKQHPQDAGLLRSLGQLCLDAQLWGKAEHYLKQSLALAETSATLEALGRLEEKSGRPQAACEHYRSALRASAQRD